MDNFEHFDWLTHLALKLEWNVYGRRKQVRCKRKGRTFQWKNKTKSRRWQCSGQSCHSRLCDHGLALEKSWIWEVPENEDYLSNG